ncbi:MAG TPA: NADH-quinone oxidoreductase subunit M [Polyangia bacterium]
MVIIRRAPFVFSAALVAAAVVAGLMGPARASDAPPPEQRPGALQIHPSSVAFERAGETARIAVANRGSGPLTVTAIRVASVGEADFTTGSVSRRTLGPGESLAVTVIYRPRAGGPRQSFAALEVEHDDLPGASGGPRVDTIALRGGEGRFLLTLLVFSPLFGLPFLLLWPRGRERWLRWLALGATLVPLGAAARMLATFDPTFARATGNFGYQMVQHVVWIRAFNVEYHVGVDGLSVGLTALTALIATVAAIGSWSIPLARNLRGYLSLLLVLETGMLGVFVSLDLFLFYVFWEMVLVPMFFLIGLWGGPRREYAAIKFFLYTLLGSVLILLAIIALYYASRSTILVDGTPAAHTLDIPKLVHLNDFDQHPALLGFKFVNLVWVLLFVGFAIKVPLVPLHTWLPDAHVEAPTAVSVVLAGILLKMGTYGMLRLNWAILPSATQWAAPVVAGLGALAVIYGGLCALASVDLKRLVAYSSIGHLGFCLIGMAALTPIAVNGAIFQMLSHGVVSALLFLLVGVIYDRTGERGLDAFGGVATVMPRYTAVFALGFFASLGLPGLSGFIGEVMTLLGSLGRFRTATVVAAFGLVLAAAYNLWAIRRIHFGALPERWRAVLEGRDLDGREWASLLPLVVLAVAMGIYPAPVLELSAVSVSDLLALFGLPIVGLGGGL